MSVTIHGSAFVFGVPENADAPIENIPANSLKVRTRFRSGRFAVAFIKTSDGIASYCLQRSSAGFHLAHMIAVNRCTPAK